MDVMETVVKLCWFAEIEVSGSLDLVKDVIPRGDIWWYSAKSRSPVSAQTYLKELTGGRGSAQAAAAVTQLAVWLEDPQRTLGRAHTVRGAQGNSWDVTEEKRGEKKRLFSVFWILSLRKFNTNPHPVVIICGRNLKVNIHSLFYPRRCLILDVV